MFGINIGFWYSISAVTAVTIISCLAAWLIPPKKGKRESLGER